MFGLTRHSCLPTVWKTAAATISTSLQQSSGAVNTLADTCSVEETAKDLRIVNIASTLGIKPEDVLHCVKVSPKLLASSPSQWQKCFAELQAQGFHRSEHLKMVTLNPSIILITERQELSNIMEVWRQFKIGHNDLLHLFTSCPHLLSVKTQDLQERIPMLKSLTKSNGKHIIRLLIGSPNVMFDNWKNVLAKIDYVRSVMDIDTAKENIAKTYLFNKDLTELKVRYMFLKRAGIYINPPKVIKGTKIEQMQQPWSKNPRLFEITDTSDEAFISKVAKGLCLEELKVFRELYMKELEAEESDLDEEESDYEDEID